MSSPPPILKIVRPFASAEEFIEAEGWTVTPKGMLLVGQRKRKVDSLVRFELALDNGERLMRAEAKVIEYSKTREDRPGGLKVRFKRFDGKTKAFIDRVVKAQKEPPKKDSEYPRREMISLPDIDEEAVLDSSPMSADIIIEGDSSPSATQVMDEGKDEDDSGVRRIALDPIEAPANRDELLQRLRERAKPAKVIEPEDDAETG